MIVSVNLCNVFIYFCVFECVCMCVYVCVLDTRYLSNQILPPVARLCSVIAETDAARLAHCLGLDPKKFHNFTSRYMHTRTLTLSVSLPLIIYSPRAHSYVLLRLSAYLYTYICTYVCAMVLQC